MHNIHEMNVPVHMLLPIGSKVKITHQGSVSLNESLILNNVLYVSDFHCTLYICQFTKGTDHTVLVHPSYCEFLDKGHQLLIGKCV